MSLLPRRLLRLAFLCALVSGSASAQTRPAPSGRVVGTVTEARTGTPLAGVNVVLGDRRNAVSRADGRFEIPGVSAGTYTLRASSVGYRVLAQPVTVPSGGAVRADLALVRGEADLGEVVVEGRATNLVGVATAASEGVVGQEQIRLRPLLRVGEVLETIPGTVVTQHSGSGKANQFFLRGFNLDHGTDFSATIEGVPMNLPTHAHGQGYLDLNSLIPELVDRVAFEKGPQNVEAGDFSTAGRAEIRLVRRLDAGIAQAEAGADGDYGGLVAGSSAASGGDLLYAVRGRYYDGPWVNPENSGLVSGVAKYSRGTEANGLAVTALAYHTGWDATDQIARRAVEGGVVSRLGALDPTNGGTTGRYTLAGAVQTTAPSAARTRVEAYAAYYHLNLFSNFTYFLDDPVQGDQFEQEDRRLYAGGGASHRWLAPGLGRGGVNTVGVDLRHDQIFGVGLFRTRDRVRVGTVRDDRVAESTVGAYVRNETRWTDWLRTTVGVRADAFRFDVESDLDANSGVETDAIVSPKLGFALGPWRSTEVYASAGLGFHSNDARGTTITVDPSSREPVDRVDPLVRTRGAELGVRTAAVAGLQSTVALWAIGLDSELLFVGDAGGTEASDASLHYGVELTNHYRAADWLDVTLDVALTESRFTDVPEGEDRIENSIGRIVTGGVYAGREAGPVGALQVRHFGPRPLTGDGSVTSSATTLVNAKAGWRFSRLAVSLDVLNVLGSDDVDVSYYYASRLRGEPEGGVEDVHFHPVLPRTARLTAQVRF
ncbi:TonB-dependent receptor [Rubrivirga sp. S365]|uniref:TonB-dependent receptor n=1 Tax=Rubrivirga litoralis TaxID=3075598 RepID=A0ABU3BLQ3_9BACT|nr:MULTISPECIES: TonB-dependent receptor [unclassified Rubrivirga]MDT0630229.1 TonB-dependent receptor [Rubrivirga sp. F394]MDT7855740.1 TonB-dependent receptor [Rubrivirga sp. S365]